MAFASSVRLIFQEIKVWRKEFHDLLDHIQQGLEFRSEFAASIDHLSNENADTVSRVNSLEQALELFKFTVNRRSNGDGASASPNPSLLQPESMLKLSSLQLEIMQIKGTVFETEDKCEKLEKLLLGANETLVKVKQNLCDLEMHMKMQKKMAAIASFNGRLLWRIDKFSAKLLDAKENDIVIKSPIFCSKQYGYTLRVSHRLISRARAADKKLVLFQLKVALNGFGTWKGRNLLASLNVIGGEWDALLAWPCKLRADIALRDQSPDGNEVHLHFCTNPAFQSKIL